MSELQRQVAEALLTIGAVGFSPQNPVTFKSGIISPVYVDNRRLIFHPQQWQVIINGFQALTESIHSDVIAGVAVGGVPHSAALAFILQQPSVFIRKETKEHGRKQRVEGGDINGKSILLIEDLITTGGSSLSGVNALRDAGGTVTDVLAIVSYGFQEAQTAFESARVRLTTLTNFTTIMQIAQEMNRFDEDAANIIRDWFHDPHGWADRQGLR